MDEIKQIFLKILEDSPNEMITFLVHKPLLFYSNNQEFEEFFINQRLKKKIKLTSIRLSNSFSFKHQLDKTKFKKIISITSQINFKYSLIMWNDNCYLFDELDKHLIKIKNIDKINQIRSNLNEITLLLE